MTPLNPSCRPVNEQIIFGYISGSVLACVIRNVICFLTIISLSLLMTGSGTLSAQTTITKSIVAGSDDAEEEGPDGDVPGAMYITSSDIELVYDPNSSQGVQIVGLRFTNLSIPAGATITDAYLTFRADTPDSGNPSSTSSTTVTIRGNDVDDASTFINSSNNISSRPVTSASINWTPTSWVTGNLYNSDPFTSVIQEIVDRPGWASGNDLALIITGTNAGGRSADSFDGDPGTVAPSLTVTYADAPSITISAAVTDEVCPTTGAIDITVDSGGTAPYSYSWTNNLGQSGGGSGLSISGLSAGTYNVMITDAASANGVLNNIVVGGPSPLALSFNTTSLSAPGANDGAIDLTASGGVPLGGPAYTYSWTKDGSPYATTEDLSGLSEGNYAVTVSDACPSTATGSANINYGVTKQLYLSDPGQSLDRIHPGLVSPVDNTTASSEQLGAIGCGISGPYQSPVVPFSNPTDITSQFGGDNSFTPDMDVYRDPSTGVETIHMVFMGKASGAAKKNIYYSSKTGAGSWSTPVLISNDTWNQDVKLFPSIKVDADNKAHVVYAHKKGTGSPTDAKINIYYVTNTSGSWSAPVRISNDGFGQDAATPEIALDDSGKSYVVYEHKNSDIGVSDAKKNIYYVTNASGSWSSPVRISDDVYNNDVLLNPTIAVDANNHSHVAYGHKSGSDAKYNIYYVTNTSGSWSSSDRVSSDLANQDVNVNPSITIDDANSPHVVYTHKDDNLGDAKENIYYSNRTSGFWSTPVDVSNDIDNQNSLNPDIAVSCTGIVRVSFSNNMDNIYYTEKDASWSSLIDLNPLIGGSQTKSSEGDNPSVALTNWNVHIVFVDKHISLGDKVDVWHTSAPLEDINGSSGSSNEITFSQATPMCSDLVLPNGSTISASLYLQSIGDPITGSSDITGVLRYGSTVIANLTNTGYTGGSNGILTLSGTPAGAFTIPAGQTIELDIINNDLSLIFTIEYDSQTKPSKIDIITSTYIDILSYAVYDAPYPGGSIITGAPQGTTVYPRVVVTDPFGSYDITGLDIDITGSPVSASSVATSGCTRTYEYVWNTSGLGGTYSIPATAKEGYEDSVTDVQPLNFDVCSPLIGAPVFNSGVGSTRCQGAATVTYNANATSATGITYSLDAASLSGGNTINASTGEVTYNASWSATSVITATASGCGGPTSATHTVTMTPTVGTPVFNIAPGAQRCKEVGTETYSASATNTTGITYSLDATSLAAGNIINSSTGTVTYVSGWFGISTITASAAGCNGPAIATYEANTVAIDAVDDSAYGEQAKPLPFNVLTNDLCQINSSSLSIVGQPENGNVQVGVGGEVLYLPNGNFEGIDSFTYEICTFGPTVVCDTAKAMVTIVEVSGDPCAEASDNKTYYLPFPEDTDYLRESLWSAASVSYLSDSIRSIISIKFPYPGTTLTYDHWEDGYEDDLFFPVQSTTIKWGDGDLTNGVAPGYPTDIIPAGGYIFIDNTFPYNPRNPADIYFDGKDKMYSSADIAVSKIAGDAGFGGGSTIFDVQNAKTNVYDISRFGQLFVVPFGEDMTLGGTGAFKYTGVFIRAATDGTVVSLDYDGDNIVDLTQNLDEGEVWFYDGTASTPGVSSDVNNANDIHAGAVITSNYDVGVDLIFGGIDSYGTRNLALLPGAYYGDTYYSPVYTTLASAPVYVFFTNTLSTDMTVRWTDKDGLTGDIMVPANGINYFNVPVSASGYKFESLEGRAFTAVSVIDADASGSTYDWSFNLITTTRLTTFSSIAWAPGSNGLVDNFAPVWVTPTANTTIYVKYDGDLTTIPNTPLNACNLPYDQAISVNSLEAIQLFDSDNDQTGMAVYTCDGTTFAAVWGEDPNAGSPTPVGSPAQDVGYVLEPRCLQQLIFANDDLEPTLINTPVTVDVDINDYGFLCLINPTSVTTAGLLQPSNGSIVVNGDGTITYTPDVGFTGVDKFEYSICSSDYPDLCDVATVRIPVTCSITNIGENEINGTVFVDENLDTLYSIGESGQSGVTVTLYEDNNEDGAVDGGDTQVGTDITDGSGNYSFSLNPVFTTVYDNSVSAACDDARDGNNGENKLQFGKDKDIGMRFTGITIPEGATITNASLYFICKTSQTGTGIVDISANDVNNPVDFCVDDNVTSRIRTSAQVEWTMSNWTQDVQYQSVDISPVIEELVDTYGAYDNENMTFIIISKGSDNHTVKSWETNNNSSEAPRLVITYTLPVHYVVEVNTATVPSNYSFTSDNVETAVFYDPNISDCENNFGIINLCTHVSQVDTDGDGYADICDLDDDNDGILDINECSEPTPCDTDGDGTPDYLDLDSDNDGCTDADEAYADLSADNDDGGIYGPGIPTQSNGLVDANGLVISAGVSGNAYTTTPATTSGGQNTFQEAIILNIDTDAVNQIACEGTTATFTAMASATVLSTLPTTTASTDVNYQWQLNGTDISGASGTVASGTLISYTTPVLTPGDDGNEYTVIFTNEATICGVETSAILTVNPTPVCNTINNGPICAGDNVILVELSDEAVSWSWSSNGSATFNNPTLQSPSASGVVNGEIFTVQITDVNGCVSTCQTTVTVYDLPVCSATNNGPICTGDNVTLNETGGDAVSWLWSSNGSATFDENTLQSPVVSGAVDGEIFTVRIIDANGCISTCQTTVTVNALPTCSASNNGPFCAGDDVILNETGGDAVSWLWSSNGSATFDDNTLQGPTASGAVDGELFTVQVTDANGCISTCQTTIDINDLPTANAGSDALICEGDSIILMASGGDSYAWSHGAGNTANVTVSPISTTTYTVTVTNALTGCEDTDDVIISVDPKPPVNITGASNLCIGETTTLTPNSGGTWTSSNAGIATVSNSGLVTAISAGTANFTFTDAVTGCPSDATANIVVNPPISANIDFMGSICLNDTSRLAAIATGGTAAFSYNWTGPNGFSSTSDTISIADDGNYYLTITDAVGCSATTSAFVYERYDPFIFTLNTEICEGEDVDLSVNSGTAVAYQWGPNAGNATTSAVTVTPSPPSTIYNVTVTNDIGCTTVASAEIDVIPKPVVSVSGPSTICYGTTTTLSPSSGGTWTSSDTAVATVTDAGVVTAVSPGSVNFYLYRWNDQLYFRSYDSSDD